MNIKDFNHKVSQALIGYYPQLGLMNVLTIRSIEALTKIYAHDEVLAQEEFVRLQQALSSTTNTLLDKMFAMTSIITIAIDLPTSIELNHLIINSTKHYATQIQ